jgi:hypothetical protein
LVQKPELKLVYFPGSSRILPGFYFPAEHGIFGRLSVSFTSWYFQFVPFSSCFEEETQVLFWSHFVKIFRVENANNQLLILDLSLFDLY